jgi:hypothetical protein
MVSVVLQTKSAASVNSVVTVRLQDWATVPASGIAEFGFARPSFLRADPADSNRVWLSDINGRLYIVDKTTKTFTTFLDFNGSPPNNGLFDKVKISSGSGFAMGLVSFQFDPEYNVSGSPGYGKFYTLHTENPDLPGSTLPDNSAFPGFNTTGYTTTSAVLPPVSLPVSDRDCILIEWSDTNTTNSTFEGTARELLRTRINHLVHPMGDLLFNPLATSSSDPDYRCLYISHGDGADGETNNARHGNPQNLGAFMGKILRIIPDLNLHVATSAVSPNGRYRIPNDNPFVGVAGARGEVWAYGFRNPHRMSWDAMSNRLFVNDIGYNTWEEVNIVERGGNYGYANHEGTGIFDVVTGVASGTPPTNAGYFYPVAEFPHSIALGYGDAVSSGFVYRGTAIPELQGRYVFGDVTTGTLFYCELADMVAAYDQDPATLATFGRINVKWDNPHNPPGWVTYSRMFEIVETEYHARGGGAAHLPGGATVSNSLVPGNDGGRADIRWAVDGNAELYLLSKSDGMIRAVLPDTDVPVTPTPTPTPTSSPIPTPTPSTTPTVSISGAISYCSNPVPGPVPSVTLMLTGSGSGSSLSDSSGNYLFSSLTSGGTYTVMPTKATLAPGSAGINTIDVVAVQRHFLNLGIRLSGCALTAADVNGVGGVNTVDVIAIQRFFLGLPTGLANVGTYQFAPMSRSYTPLVTSQTGQNYDALIFGDVASTFVH